MRRTLAWRYPPAEKLIKQLSGNAFNTEDTEDTEKKRENAISVFSSVSSVFKSSSANHFQDDGK